MNLANIQLDKQKKILIAICCIFIVYVEFNYILKSQIDSLSSLKPKIIKLENDLKDLNRDLETMRGSKNTPGAPEQKPVLKSSRILSEGQISGLLEDISNEAKKLDIRINQIRPGREAQGTAAPTDKLAPVLINLDLICDYHNLGKFINRLESSDVFMGVQEIKISAQLPDYLKQKVTLIIKTYVAK